MWPAVSRRRNSLAPRIGDSSIARLGIRIVAERVGVSSGSRRIDFEPVRRTIESATFLVEFGAGE
ncbi:MAG: hypothetical protein H6870_13395 [Methylobacteriaceae bacterium]|nr:hypothetical protein [Methylobacteriaceae bacterium]